MFNLDLAPKLSALFEKVKREELGHLWARRGAVHKEMMYAGERLVMDEFIDTLTRRPVLRFVHMQTGQTFWFRAKPEAEETLRGQDTPRSGQ